MYMYVRIVCVYTPMFLPSIALSLSLFHYISTPQCRHTLAALLEVLAGHKLPKSEKTGDTRRHHENVAQRSSTSKRKAKTGAAEWV